MYTRQGFSVDFISSVHPMFKNTSFLAFRLRVTFIFLVVRIAGKTFGGRGITFAESITTFAPKPVVGSWFYRKRKEN